jgi:hypothetical protein
MGNGHLGMRELLVISVLLIGIVAAVLLLSGSGSPQQAPAASNDTNATQEPAAQPAAEPPPPEPEPEAPAAETTQPPPVKTTGELLDEGLARASARFDEVAEPAVWSTQTNRWALGNMNQTPDSIPLKENDIRVSGIRFEDRYIDSLRGFAFKAYNAANLTAPMKIFGVAVFLSNSTTLDSYNGTFNMRYDPHPELSQVLEGCSILEVRDVPEPSGADVKVYDFRCKLMYGASG